MSVRGARVLLAGACAESGRRLCEAFLALGSHVVAADRLRTRIEELRAELRQHERLFVAEADLSTAPGALALFADVARDEPIDIAVLVLAAAPGADAWAFPADMLEEQASALARCFWFLRAARANMAGPRARVLVVLEPAADDLHASLAPAVHELTRRCAASVHAGPTPLAIAGLSLAPVSGSAWLERAVSLCDPDRPARHGWLEP